MFIENLSLLNFRNYDELHIKFDKATNLLYGDNAQGKTNIIEAIYMCSSGKSHKGSKDREIISFNKDESHIKARISKKGIPYVIDVHLKKNNPKGIAINGLPIRKASELFGVMNVICFSPEDLNIIKEGPAGRRRFIDMELCQLSPVYVKELINYNKTLIQKNRLLKELDFRRDWEEMLDIYDIQLERFGRSVSDERAAFTEELNGIIEKIHHNLTGGRELLRLQYEPCEIRNLRKEEIRQRTVLSGPHRDDLAFYVNNIDLRKFGSQGQQRTAALSLKLAEIELVKNKTDDCPVLLLDDVLSELDTGRQNNLLNAITDIQTIITCTGIEEYQNSSLNVEKTMYVKEGRVTDAEE